MILTGTNLDNGNIKHWVLFFSSSRLMALQEEEKTNKWKQQDICIGSRKACAFPGMISSYSKFIISFAEDEAGRYHASCTVIGNCTVSSVL